MKQLQNTELSAVKGGVTKAEYCATAKMIIENNPVPASGAAAAAKICEGEPGW